MQGPSDKGQIMTYIALNRKWKIVQHKFPLKTGERGVGVKSGIPKG
jgi:hypothetical protein